MARYPTFEEYDKTGKYPDGIKRCNDLLKKHPNDVQLLTVKLQLLAASQQNVQPVLAQLLALEPPITDLAELYTINAALVQSQHNTWPRPRTAGPEMAQLWDAAVKASPSPNHKLELQLQRFEAAVHAARVVDMQQALIALKALQPRNRVVYMAHAAATQLSATAEAGDVQARLALMLARKAVKEDWDAEGGLDCRVPGQIFAAQGAREDLEGCRGRGFGESKAVFEALKGEERGEMNGVVAMPEPKDSMTVSATPTEGLPAEIASLKTRFAELVHTPPNPDALLAFAATAIRIFHTSLSDAPTQRTRTKAEAAFLAISALIKTHTLTPERHQKPGPLLLAAHLAEALLHQCDPHIHEARLVLVYLYTALNLGSLAITYFDSLRIKEVQLDTVGHALFTDLSLIHPHHLSSGAVAKEDRNPMSRAKSAVQMYRRYEEKLAEAEAGVLGNGQTGMLFDLHALREDLRASITKRIVLLELRRQARLLADESSRLTHDIGPACVANWLETRDNRDVRATFDYGVHVERALHGDPGDGALPGRGWILRALVADAAWCLAGGRAAESPVEDPRALLAALDEGEMPDAAALRVDDGETSGVSPDLRAADLACQVLRLTLLVSAKAGGEEVRAGVEGVERAVRRLDVTGLCAGDDVCAGRLRECYGVFDALKIAERGCGMAGQEGERVQRRVKDEMAALRAHAEGRRKGVSVEGVRREMGGAGEVFAAVEALGEEEVGRFCEAVVEAAREGWSGVGMLKV